MSKLTVQFAGITFLGLHKNEILTDQTGFKIVCTMNAQLIRLFHTNPDFRAVVHQSIATFDGTIPVYLARIANPNLAIDKISGVDLLYDSLRKAVRTGERIFLLGANQASNATAVLVARSKYGVTIEGYSPSTAELSADLQGTVFQRISAFRPDYLFVGLGAPTQELWIARNRKALEALGIKAAIGCGGSIDFLAGRFKRAPQWVQSLGAEGIFRLMQEPSWKRLRRLVESASVFLYAFRR